MFVCLVPEQRQTSMLLIKWRHRACSPSATAHYRTLTCTALPPSGGWSTLQKHWRYSATTTTNGPSEKSALSPFGFTRSSLFVAKVAIIWPLSDSLAGAFPYLLGREGVTKCVVFPTSVGSIIISFPPLPNSCSLIPLSSLCVSIAVGCRKVPS